MNNSYRKQGLGFTLIELAVVLVIVGLLLGGLLLPLSAQIDIKNSNETKEKLVHINEAIYGFVIINNRLPCPTFEDDPENPDYGIETTDITECSLEGYLPWKTLGVSQTDAWGTPRTLIADSWNGHWRYRVDSNFVTTLLFEANILLPSSSDPFADDFRIFDSYGTEITTTTGEKPLAIIYSTGKDLTANELNSNPNNNRFTSGAMTQDFDDYLIWIPRTVLVNRLASADKLP